MYPAGVAQRGQQLSAPRPRVSVAAEPSDPIPVTHAVAACSGVVFPKGECPMYDLSKRFDREFTALSDWRPAFGELDRWFAEMDRAFGQATPFEAAPQLTSVKTEDGYEVRADLPGFSEEQIQLDLHDGVLTLSGARDTTEPDESAAARRERGNLKFSASLRLPKDVDATAVTARLSDGVLTVLLGQREEVKPRQIEVQAG